MTLKQYEELVAFVEQWDRQEQFWKECILPIIMWGALLFGGAVVVAAALRVLSS